jgi:hypothetical protein
MKRLIYLKNGQSFDLFVSPLKLSSHDFVDHVSHGFKTKKKKEYKDDFFKTILIQLPCILFKYIFVHMRQKKTFKVLSFV